MNICKWYVNKVLENFLVTLGRGSTNLFLVVFHFSHHIFSDSIPHLKDFTVMQQNEAISNNVRTKYFEARVPYPFFFYCYEIFR